MASRLHSKKGIELTSFSLHLLAMLFMLCDHMWATIIPGSAWLTTVGRIAFPIFAFLLVEGYFHTKSLRRYLCRLLFLAILSEIPFDLMYGGQAFYPFHQNVIWTFLIGILCIHGMETSRKSGKIWLFVVASALLAAIGFVLGMALMVDYYGYGVLTVLVFYFFRGEKGWQRLGRWIGLWILNGHLLAGLTYPISLFGFSYNFPQQGAAMLALLPIGLYHGRQGYHSRWVQLSFYLFYPAHILILALLCLI